MKNKDGGEGERKLNREGGGGGLVDFPLLKRWGGGLIRGGGGLNRGFTVCDFPEPAHHYYLVT